MHRPTSDGLQRLWRMSFSKCDGDGDQASPLAPDPTVQLYRTSSARLLRENSALLPVIRSLTLCLHSRARASGKDGSRCKTQKAEFTTRTCKPSKPRGRDLSQTIVLLMILRLRDNLKMEMIFPMTIHILQLRRNQLLRQPLEATPSIQVGEYIRQGRLPRPGQ